MRQIIAIIVILIFGSCEKWSHLDFTTDKAYYAAGDTVKLYRQSEKGRKLVWIMPDGSKEGTFDATYVIDPTMGFGELSFSLKDESNLHLKKRQQTKSVRVYPQSYMQTNPGIREVPHKISCSSTSSNYMLEADGSFFYGSGHWWCIYFPPGGPPAQNSYSVQPTLQDPVPANTACVIRYDRPNHYFTMPIPTQYTAGVINVDYNADIMHISFSGLPSWTMTSANTTLDGSLYLPQ